MKINYIFSILSLFTAFALQAQPKKVTGIITDRHDGSPVIGATVQIKGMLIATSTDADGHFAISAPEGSATLEISAMGYEPTEEDISTRTEVNVMLEQKASDTELEEVVVNIGRGEQRTLVDTPMPVDNFNADELKTTGQPSFDKALQYRVPSFNAINVPVADATSLFAPYEIRNLGPSRTLILINGKRKNLTSLVYVQNTPGVGETGADLTAIPQDAIQRVEILRDGASAQYGSDAIAGVINVVLKNKYDGSSFGVTTGSTTKYGGFQYMLNFNSGATFKNKGYLNYHISFLREERINRADPMNAAGDARDNTDNSPASQAQVRNFLAQYPDGFNKNGTPDNTSAKFLINGAIPLNERAELYFNAAYVYRKTVSYANYRQPYWKLDQGLLHTPDPNAPDYTVDATSYYKEEPDSLKIFNDGKGFDILNADKALKVSNTNEDKKDGVYKGYVGYQPTFEGDLSDYNGTFGLHNTTENGWKQDISLTIGGNKMLFTADRTVNKSLLKNSPVYFKNGGFSFNHLVGNADFSKALLKNLYLAVGSEFRMETWQLIHAIDTSAYVGEGADSFPGFSAKSAINASRYNIGAYVDLTWDITPSLLLAGAFRSERYSDFGAANVFKFSSRYKIKDGYVLRASFSSGFRAPTLHQQYLSQQQAQFTEGTINTTGLANNLSREAQLLGIPRLKAEKSINATVGVGFTPIRNFSLTVDYYYIRIKDRVIYSKTIDDEAKGVKKTNFFLNAAETITQGIDVVTSYNNIRMGAVKLNINVGANYTIQNELVGGYQGVNQAVGLEVFDKKYEYLMTTSRPKYKVIVGFDVSYRKFSFNLNNTIFGPTKFGDEPNIDKNVTIVFNTKMLTDLSVSYRITPKMSVSLTAQNLFNVMPKWHFTADNAKGEAILNNPDQAQNQWNGATFNGRYPVVPANAAHFNQFGTYLMGQFNYNF